MLDLFLRHCLIDFQGAFQENILADAVGVGFQISLCSSLKQKNMQGTWIIFPVVIIKDQNTALIKCNFFDIHHFNPSNLEQIKPAIPELCKIVQL